MYSVLINVYFLAKGENEIIEIRNNFHSSQNSVRNMF